MEAPDDFYVELPSNSSNNIFPDNTHANYKVKLARPLMLTEDYEVALVEVFFLKKLAQHCERRWKYISHFQWGCTRVYN